MAEKPKSRAAQALFNSAKKPRGKPFDNNNVHAFRKGQSGNPLGRPKSITLSEAYRAELAKLMPDDSQGRSCAEMIAAQMVKEAVTGAVACAKELADRTEGRARQQLEINATLHDWRAMASANGLSEEDVLLEARRLIESVAITGGAESD